MHDIEILFEISYRRYHRVAAPIGDGRGDYIIGDAPNGYSAAASAAALALVGIWNMLMQMGRDSTHAYLVAEVANRDIEHAHGAELIEEDIHFRLKVGHIKSCGVMVLTDFIFAGRFDADNSGGLAVGDYLIGTALCL